VIIIAPVSELDDEIAHLRDLDLRGLRARWHSVFRRKAPDHLPRHLLYRMIAYRLQAERLGDLDRDTQRFLDRVAAGTRKGDELRKGATVPAVTASSPEPSWCGSGTACPSVSSSWTRALPGTEPPIAA
jgi:hypothetical protein